MSKLSLLLLGDTNSAAASASCLSVLTTDTDTPVVSETAVSANLLKTLEILADLVVERVGGDLRVLAVLDVLLSVEKPVGNLVVTWVRHDRDHAVDLLLGELAGSLVDVDVGLAQADVREAATHTLDGGHGVADLDAAINVGVEHTQNVLKLLRNDQRGHIHSVHILIRK